MDRKTMYLIVVFLVAMILFSYMVAPRAEETDYQDFQDQMWGQDIIIGGTAENPITLEDNGYTYEWYRNSAYNDLPDNWLFRAEILLMGPPFDCGGGFPVEGCMVLPVSITEANTPCLIGVSTTFWNGLPKPESMVFATIEHELRHCAGWRHIVLNSPE